MATSTLDPGPGDHRPQGRPRHPETDAHLPLFPSEDRHGQPLQVGDRVVIPCVVTEVGRRGHLNVTLETDHPMRPGMETSTRSFASHQVEKATEVAPVPVATPVAACRLAPGSLFLDDGVAADVERANLVMHAVYYREEGRTLDLLERRLPLATFLDRDDATVWIANQAQYHGLDPEAVEVVALQVVVPLVARK